MLSANTRFNLCSLGTAVNVIFITVAPDVAIARLFLVSAICFFFGAYCAYEETRR